MKISEKNTKNEISPEQPNRTGQKSKSVSPNTPSNIIQLRANGTFGRQCPRSGEGCLTKSSMSKHIVPEAIWKDKLNVAGIWCVCWQQICGTESFTPSFTSGGLHTVQYKSRVCQIMNRFVVLSVITFVGAVYRVLTIFVPVFRWVGQILHSQVKVIFPCVSNCFCVPYQSKILRKYWQPIKATFGAMGRAEGWKEIVGQQGF